MEALEADFLQDLYKLRQLKAETSRALHKVRLLALCHCIWDHFCGMSSCLCHCKQPLEVERSVVHDGVGE